MKRTLYENIWERLSAHKQMVFIAGPRQTGKTTFTQILAEDFNNSRNSSINRGNGHGFPLSRE